MKAAELMSEQQEKNVGGTCTVKKHIHEQDVARMLTFFEVDFDVKTEKTLYPCLLGDQLSKRNDEIIFFQ